MTNDFPHGECECRDGCQCEDTPGPAAFSVVRDGKKMRVCTRCYLKTDSAKKLLVTRTDSSVLYFSYDVLGALLIAAELNEEKTMGKDKKNTESSSAMHELVLASTSLKKEYEQSGNTVGLIIEYEQFRAAFEEAVEKGWIKST